MSQFVLVASGVSNEDFEKAIEVKIRSNGMVSFVPQASNQHGAITTGMSSTKSAPQQSNSPEILNVVRLEWNQAGEQFGAEIVRLLAGHRHNQEETREPAA